MIKSLASFGWGGACLVALALTGCASTPADEDPVQIKLKDLDTRLVRIERVVANQSLLELANESESLRADLRAMHNDVDQLTNTLEAGRKQQRVLYTDLDRRMKALESHGASAGSGVAAAGDAGAAVAGGIVAGGAADMQANDDKAAYQTAFGLLKDSQYDRAIAAFQKFLASFPNSQLADNGQYWLGEAYYVNKSFPEALAAFQRMVDKYPQSRKRPDALLKIGYCQYELKQPELARNTLTLVTTQFPDTPAAHLAQQRLEKMAAEKN
ncbi:MAG: tol-pal system protein YbgF [Gammaproteobacteria bacterium]